MADGRQKVIILLLVVAVIVLGCGSGKKPAQAVRESEVVVETIPALTVVTVNRTGPYSEIGNVIKEMMAQLEKKGIVPAGAPFAFYYNSPEMVPPESCEWAVCIPVPAGTSGDAQAGIAVRVLEPMEVAVAVHTGGWDKVSATYQQVMDWIDDNEWEIAGPAVEFFLSPADGSPDSMRTKVGFIVNTALDEEEDFEEEESIDLDSEG